jgi:hypothetical protein
LGSLYPFEVVVHAKVNKGVPIGFDPDLRSNEVSLVQKQRLKVHPVRGVNQRFSRKQRHDLGNRFGDVVGAVVVVTVVETKGARVVVVA